MCTRIIFRWHVHSVDKSNQLPCVCRREYTVLAQEREDDCVAFRSSWRARHNGSTRYRYPSDLLPMPPFSYWLYDHVRRLRAEGFPVPRNLVRLSCQPSAWATRWHRMYVRGAHFRCHRSEGAPCFRSIRCFNQCRRHPT